ncbi:MAG: hypothetical protein U9R40_04955 [Synergistota bacterium]|nr:hypothetical protein [Synergistota bacterium]
MTHRIAGALVLVVALAATCRAGGASLAWNESLGGDFGPGADGTRLLAGRTEYVYYVAEDESTAKATGWKQFEAADFTMDIPPGSRISTGDNGVRINLPRTPGTMLDERSATVSVTGAGSEADCFSGIPEGNNVSVAGLRFRVLPGTKWEADMGGKRYYMAEYATLAGDRCVRITFRMLMRDLTGFTDDPPRPAPPETETDTAVFERMLESFRLAE